MAKLKWKRDYGDNEPTYDSVLWIDNQPTQHSVCQSSGVYYVYLYGKRFALADSLQEAKNIILENIA